MKDQITDVVIPILKQVQADNAHIKTEIMGIKEYMGSIDKRLENLETRTDRVEVLLTHT